MVSLLNVLTNFCLCSSSSIFSSRGRLASLRWASALVVTGKKLNRQRFTTLMRSSKVFAVEVPQNLLVVGDGDLSYSSLIAEDMSNNNTCLFATVLEDEETHNKVYKNSKNNAEHISSFPLHHVQFGVDGTNLKKFFPETRFDGIEFNFPHWPGKTNAKRNRALVDGFLESASSVLKPEGRIRISLCDSQGGLPAESLQEWRQSWMPSMYAAKHGLLLTQLESYQPNYGLSSHRGVDRPFFIGNHPQEYIFQFPNGDSVCNDLQLSCRHELRIMLHPDKLAQSAVSYDSIVNGNAVAELGQEFIPDGIRFEVPARHLLTPYELEGEHVPLAVFLLNYSGESKPLTREAADTIRDLIERSITERWGLDIAKGGRLVSRPFPYMLLPKLIKEYN